ncbi:MAG: hypothetical protein JNL11_09560 [Bdellovibrionaceae bacterium]|nr:hypothetical protein [Pseudobdellovibrionaceae bacterium]
MRAIVVRIKQDFIKTLYTLKYFFACSIFFSITEVFATTTCDSFYSPATPKAAIIKVLPAALVREKLYAVHATNFLPKDGVIVADGRGLEIPVLRSEIHFSLGGLVPAHISGNWESRKFAVVTPLSGLEPQLANLMVFDTIIYGDFKIPKGSTLVIPDGIPIKPLPNDITVYYYSAGTTLRTAIENVIKSKSGWVLKTKYGDGRKDDEAIIEEFGININSPVTLKEIFDQRPNVTFLNGVQTKGDIISQWSRFLLKYFAMKDRLYITTAQIRFEKRKLEIFANSVRSDVDALYLTDIPRNGYLKFASKVRHLNHFLSLEIELRERFGRSIFSSDPKAWMPKVLPLIQHHNKLRKLVFSNIEKFEIVHQGNMNIYAETIADDLVTLSKKNVISLLNKFPDFFRQVEEGDKAVFDYFVVKRLAAIGPKNADQEKLLSDIESAFERASKTRYGIAKLLLSIIPRNSDSFGYLLKSSKITNILSAEYDINKFNLINNFEQADSNIDFMRFIKRSPPEVSN